MNALQFRRALRTDLKNRFTSWGSYPVALFMHDGGALCWDCAHQEKDKIHMAALERTHCGWRPLAADVNWEDPDLFCDNCNERIESAYAEPEAT